MARPGMLVYLRAAVVLSGSIALAQSAGLAQRQEGSSSITGTVHKGAGEVVAEASVRLQAQGNARAEERKTDTSGAFGFSRLETGAYVLSASKGEQHSNEVTVSITAAGAVQHVDLILPNGERPQRAEMEFSDAPNFTVAAVTDWTAAGGHGSDTSLRMTEDLTRETVRLKPDPIAGSNTDGSRRESEADLRGAVEASPRDINANERLGRFYLAAERYSDAVPPLETAFELDRGNEQNEYHLALALARSGKLADAREHVARLLAKQDRPQWHRAAGEIAEKSGDPLSAVREFERAARGDPSEENYFAWGSELLEHRAIWQARDVFEAGAKAYPKSARMLTALGAALFSGALYEEAARRLCEASDLMPTDARPYLFMGKVEIASPNSLPCIETKLQRFVQMAPGNPFANLYYALSYWKEHGKRVDAETSERVKTYLNRAVKADPKCSDAYLQLGVLEASRADFAAAADFYKQAISANPQSSEAHYRLGVAYDRLGSKDKAAEEFKRHDELEKEQAEIIQRQRKEIKQFLVQVGANSQDTSARP